jgi:hypothetical protein
MKIALNHNDIGTLAVPGAGQLDYWDSRQAGLGVRVSQGGTRTWIAMFRHAGKLRRAVLGHWPSMGLTEARKEARKLRAASDAGVDPAASDDESDDDGQGAIPADQLTVADLADVYLTHHARVNKRPRSVTADIQMLNSAILPKLGEFKVTAVKRADIRLLLDGIVARGAMFYANRVRALLHTMFNVGVDRELLENNPVARVKRPLKHEQSRERTLDDDEIRALWTALAEAPLRAQVMFKLLLLTATRKSEVCGVPWSELDLDNGELRIPG